MKLIDLGLYSGTLWADCNLGSTEENLIGDFYRFGDKTPFKATSCKYKVGITERLGISTTPYDVVKHTLGGNFRMPTREDVVEIAGFCKIKWEEINCYGGYRLTGPNGNSIFFPVIDPEGFEALMWPNGERYKGVQGRYWTSLLSPRNFAFSLMFTKDSKIPVWYMRYERDYGALIRPVADRSWYHCLEANTRM